MGVSTSLKIAFYSKEKELIKKYDLAGRADEYIYSLVNDGGATFEPEKFGDFNESQKEALKVYFDQESLSVSEGYAKVTTNIQSPKELKPLWLKIRSSIIRSFNSKMKDYHDKLSASLTGLTDSIHVSNEGLEKRNIFSKKKKIEVSDIATPMSEYDFDRALFNIVWSIDSISEVLTMLNMAIADDVLIEISAADY
jgi:hypothetical protein